MEVLESSRTTQISRDYLLKFQMVFLQEQRYSDRDAGEIFTALRKKAMRDYSNIMGFPVSDDEFRKMIAELPEGLKQEAMDIAQERVRTGTADQITKDFDGHWQV